MCTSTNEVHVEKTSTKGKQTNKHREHRIQLQKKGSSPRKISLPHLPRAVEVEKKWHGRD
jgi:hypothetical protein